MGVFKPDDRDRRGKQILVIGGGVTAVTLVPALANAAAPVAMLRRSLTYIVVHPSVDLDADWIR
jgi:cation diffusion facilitator CzcD-associated flavoprotein CzcO